MKRNCLFILVDCLRADKCWGESKTAKTPNIDLLCRRGTAFVQTIAAATDTITSVTSILTGLYPFAHGVRTRHGNKLGSGITTLTEILRQNGYHTYAEVTGPLMPQIGINKGFEHYHLRDKSDDISSPWYNRLLTKFKGNEFKEPYFILIHFWELHQPRFVAKEYDNSNYGKNKYERALSSLDASLGELWRYIDDNTIIILHADHGEKIAETMREEYIKLLTNYLLKLTVKLGFKVDSRLQLLGHGFHVYDYLVRVPLIFVGEGIFPEGKQIVDQVRSVDLFPTIVEALGLKPDNIKQIHGRSLLPLISGEELPEVPAYCEASKGLLGGKARFGIRTVKYKYIFAPYASDIPDELYNLEKDPKENNNIVAQRPEMVRELRQKLQEIRKEDEVTVAKRKIKGLKALGKI